MARLNPYAPLTEEQKLEQERIDQEASKIIKATRENAQKCMSMPEFEKYLNNLNQANQKLFGIFLDIEDDDQLKEWKIFKGLQIEARNLKLLLKGVLADTRGKEK